MERKGTCTTQQREPFRRVGDYESLSCMLHLVLSNSASRCPTTKGKTIFARETVVVCVMSTEPVHSRGLLFSCCACFGAWKPVSPFPLEMSGEWQTSSQATTRINMRGYIYAANGRIVRVIVVFTILATASNMLEPSSHGLNPDPISRLLAVYSSHQTACISHVGQSTSPQQVECFIHRRLKGCNGNQSQQ